MADFGTFQIETPQEVMARLNAQRQQAMTSGNTVQAQTAALQTVFQGLFGNPEVTEAEARTNAAEEAFSDLDRRPDEDDLDFQKRQVETFFESVKDVDPALAAQAAEQLTVLQNEQIERDQLLAAEDRRKSNEERLASQEDDRQTKRRREDQFDNIGYAVDRRTGAIKTFDLSTESGRQEMSSTARDPNQQILTREEMVDRDETKLKQAETDFFNRSTFAKKLDTYDATQDSVNRMDRIVEILTELPDTLTVASNLEKTITNLNQELGAGLRKTGLDLGGYDKDLQKVRNRIAPEARARGVTDAMVLNLAYSLARALDPGGRLSDKDLELALDMIGGQNSDPSILARIALEQIELQTQKLTDSFDALNTEPAFREGGQGRILTKKQEQLLAKRGQLRERVRPFISKEEFDNIVFGIPLKPAAVEPAAPATTNAAGETTEIVINIQGLD